MSSSLETASEYLRLAAKRAEQDNVQEALRYMDEARVILERASLPTPQEQISGERSFEKALSVSEYMRLRRVGAV